MQRLRKQVTFHFQACRPMIESCYLQNLDILSHYIPINLSSVCFSYTFFLSNANLVFFDKPLPGRHEVPCQSDVTANPNVILPEQ